MVRSGWKLLIIGAVLAAAVALSPAKADAFGCHHWRWGASYGCASCWTPSWGAWYSPYYDYGWYRPWGCGYRAGCFYPRWSGCGWGCCWDTYAVTDCCATGIVSSPGFVPSTPAGQRPTLAPPVPPVPPAQPPAPPKTGMEGMDETQRPGPIPPTPPGAKTPPAPSPPPGGATTNRADAMLLTVRVPAEAKVLVNGYETRSTGTERRYVSYGLKSGKTYPYTITVLMPRGSEASEGDAVRATKTVYAKAGEDLRLAFTDDLRTQEQLVATAK